jgi:serine protease Do
MSATARPARWDPTARGGAGGWVADADPDVPGPPAGPAPSEVAGTGSMTVPPRPARPPPRPATAPARPASPPPSAAPPPPPQAAAPSVMSGPASGSAGRGYDAPLVAGPDRGYDAPTGARFLPPEHEQQAAAATPHRRRMGALISAAVALLLVAGAAVVLLVVRPFDHKAGRPAAAGAVTPQTTAPAAAPQATQPVPSASADSSFATLYQQDSGGVVRIETVSCDGDGVGSGFLLSPTLVATVKHVVDQATVISLVVDGQRTVGTVIGSDAGQDLALVRASRPLAGYQFALGASLPAVGSRVAAVGFPEGQPITLTQGGISGLHRTITIAGADRSELIQTDTPVNPGNSGGPLLDMSGAVVGLVDALDTRANGIAYAIPATQASVSFSAWESAPQARPAATCSSARGPDYQTLPGLTQSDPNAQAGPLTALSNYFHGINSNDYATAYAILSPSQQARSFESFRAALLTSYDTDFQVLEVTPGSGSTTVALAFTSLQAPTQGPSGETCDRWTLDYRMIQDSGGSWRIDNATGHDGSSHSAC